MYIHIAGPEAGSEGSEDDGMIARYGVRKYAIGNNGKNHRKPRKVPKRAWTGG